MRTRLARLVVLGVSTALLLPACDKPPGRATEVDSTREAAPSEGGERANASDRTRVANDVPADVMCDSISAMPGYACADDPTRRGREGDRCPNGDPMVASEDVYAFPEAPVSAREIPANVHVTSSGLGTCIVRRGSGSAKPRRTDRVTVHYLGWNEEQGVFDSSVSRNEPATFPLDAVIAGWTEGVAMMVEGEVRRFFIPEPLAYQGRLGRPSGMLLFDVELLAIGGE
jgi:hypothetical protein